MGFGEGRKAGGWAGGRLGLVGAGATPLSFPNTGCETLRLGTAHPLPGQWG